VHDNISLQDQHNDHMPLYIAKADLYAFRVDTSCKGPSTCRDTQGLEPHRAQADRLSVARVKGPFPRPIPGQVTSACIQFIYSGRQKSVSKTSPCLAEQFVCDDSSI